MQVQIILLQKKIINLIFQNIIFTHVLSGLSYALVAFTALLYYLLKVIFCSSVGDLVQCYLYKFPECIYCGAA